MKEGLIGREIKAKLLKPWNNGREQGIHSLLASLLGRSKMPFFLLKDGSRKASRSVGPQPSRVRNDSTKGKKIYLSVFMDRPLISTEAEDKSIYRYASISADIGREKVCIEARRPTGKTIEYGYTRIRKRNVS